MAGWALAVALVAEVIPAQFLDEERSEVERFEVLLDALSVRCHAGVFPSQNKLFRRSSKLSRP